MSKRDQILEAALELFITQGIDKTPTAQISKQAGVATGTLFHHFKTKEDLVDALYLSTKLRLKAALDVGIDPEATVQVKMARINLNMLEWGLENPDPFRLLVQLKEASLVSEETKREAEEAFVDLMAILHQGFEEGLFVNLPMELVASILFSNIVAGCTYLMQHPESATDAVKKQLVECCWKSVAA